MTHPAEPHISGADAAAHVHRAVAPQSPGPAISLLSLSAAGRLAGVAVALVCLWAGAWWAMR